MSLNRLLSEPLRLPLEQRVSTYLGRPWQVQSAEDMQDAASHPAAVLSDGTYAVFVKLAEGSDACDRATREIEGLATLTARAGVLTPPAIGAVPVDDGAEGAAEEAVLLILEAVVPISAGAKSGVRWGRRWPASTASSASSAGLRPTTTGAASTRTIPPTTIGSTSIVSAALRRACMPPSPAATCRWP